MTTKDQFLFFKNKQQDLVVNDHGQFNNLNLNQNYRRTYAEVAKASLNIKNQNKAISNYEFVLFFSDEAFDRTAVLTSSSDNSHNNDLQTRQNFTSFGKTNLSATFTNPSIQKDYGKKEEKILNANNSTLSLHITAYENSIEATSGDPINVEKDETKKNKENISSIKNWKAVKEIFKGSSSSVKYAFELPRQQQDQNNDPELMQFKASQRLQNVKDPVWSHYDGDKNIAFCKYCNQSYTSGKVGRMREHLVEKCCKVPASVRAEIRRLLASKRAQPSPQIQSSSQQIISRRSISSPPAKKQSTLGSFIDSMPKEVNERCQELLVRALVTGGVGLTFLGNEEFKTFLDVLRPGFAVPNRQRAQKQIVSKIYEEEKIVLERSINCAQNVAISTDGWKDINKNHMMNFIVHTPAEWLHSFQPEIDSDAVFISNKILELVDKIGPAKVVALISDHASNMILAGKLVAEKYPWITHCGCQGHGLNLGCKDICKTKLFQLLISQNNQILKFFGSKHSLAALSKAFENQNLKEKKLQMPVSTRFATNYTSMQSIRYAKNAIREAVNYPKLDKQKNVAVVRKIVNDPKFWQKLDDLMQILKPLSTAIIKLEKSALEFGEGRLIVKLAFTETLNKIENCSFNDSFKNSVSNAIEKRKEFCSNDLDYVLAMIDPRQKGDELSPKERMIALKRIDKLKLNPRINSTKLDQELRLWAEGGGIFAHDYYPEAWLSLESNITPKQWWSLYFNKTELSTILSMILATPLTSVASERTWSVRNLIHSKSRNRLALSSADKLVFLKYNLALKKKYEKKREKEEVERELNDESVAANHNQIEEDLEEISNDLEDDFSADVYDLEEDELNSDEDSDFEFGGEQENMFHDGSSDVDYSSGDDLDMVAQEMPSDEVVVL